MGFWQVGESDAGYYLEICMSVGFVMRDKEILMLEKGRGTIEEISIGLVFLILASINSIISERAYYSSMISLN
jgi:hypothetical protein